MSVDLAKSTGGPIASLVDIERLHELLAGYAVTSAIVAAAELGIVDQLAAGPLSSEEIARRCSAAHDPMHRLLRALAGVGVVHEQEQGLFSLTSTGAALRSDVAQSLHAIVTMVGSEWYWRSWGALAHAVRTGSSAFQHVFDADFFSYIRQRPEVARGFHAGMTSLSSISDGVLASAYDFSQHRHVVDVGGGRGGLLAAILESAPGLRGTLYDQADAIASAVPALTSGALAHRCTVVAGDFFESVPTGADAYVLKHVLHGLDHDKAVTLLRRVGEAMGQGGWLVVVDMAISGPNEAGYAKLNDLGMMLLSSNGRERTEEEFVALFTSAGFRAPTITRVQMGLEMLVACRA